MLCEKKAALEKRRQKRDKVIVIEAYIENKTVEIIPLLWIESESDQEGENGRSKMKRNTYKQISAKKRKKRRRKIASMLLLVGIV